MVSSNETVVVSWKEIHKTLTVSRARECIKAAPFNQPRTIDRAIIGVGVLIGTISFITTIPGAFFSYGEGPSVRGSSKSGQRKSEQRKMEAKVV